MCVLYVLYVYMCVVCVCVCKEHQLILPDSPSRNNAHAREFPAQMQRLSTVQYW